MATKSNNRLAYKLLIGVLVCSTVLSAIATSVQLYLTFERQDELLHETTGEIQRGFGQSLSVALWSFDEQQVNKILHGIHAQADIAYLKLSTDWGRVWERGPDDPNEKLQIDTVELVHNDPLKGEITLGTLELGLSRAHIWSDLYAQVLVVFLSNIVKTGLASIAILLLFHHLISRHLRSISSFLSEPNWLSRAPELSLERKANHASDELDSITTALNTTRREFLDVNQDLSAASEKLRAVLDATANGIVGLDRDGQVAVINPAARHMLGGKSEETPFAWPQAIKFLDIVDLHPLDASSDPINRSLAGQTLNNETHLMTREGDDQNRYVRVSSSKVDDPSTDLRCVVALDDVSQMERNRQQAERKSRLDALGQLTGGIAHDFNNLLATILYAMQLTRTDEISDRSDRVLETAIGAVERGRELTGRLLAFAKRQPGLMKSRTVDEVFTGIAGLARTAIEETVELKFVDADPELLVHCDHGQLENALLNLTLNSRDAIMRSGKGGQDRHQGAPHRRSRPRPGRCGARTCMPTLPRACARNIVEDVARSDDAHAYRYVEISVTDDGPGMSDEIKRRAIDPFFTTKDTNSGTGLGLSMVYGFIQQSDGELAHLLGAGFRHHNSDDPAPRARSDNEREAPIARIPIQHGNGEKYPYCRR